MTDYVITAKASVESDLPRGEVESIVGQALNDLAVEYGVTLDSVEVREGDGL